MCFSRHSLSLNLSLPAPTHAFPFHWASVVSVLHPSIVLFPPAEIVRVRRCCVCIKHSSGAGDGVGYGIVGGGGATGTLLFGFCTRFNAERGEGVFFVFWGEGGPLPAVVGISGLMTPKANPAFPPSPIPFFFNLFLEPRSC